MKEIHSAGTTFHVDDGAYLDQQSRSVTLVLEYPAALELPNIVTILRQHGTLRCRDQDVLGPERISLLDRVDSGKLQNEPAFVYSRALQRQGLRPAL